MYFEEPGQTARLYHLLKIHVLADCSSRLKGLINPQFYSHLEIKKPSF